MSISLEVIKLEFILKLNIKRNDWLLADTCPQLKIYNLEARSDKRDLKAYKGLLSKKHLINALNIKKNVLNQVGYLIVTILDLCLLP